MKKFAIFSILFFFTLNIHATKHTHIDTNEIRYIKNKLPLNSLLQHTLRTQPLWQNFLQNNPNWFVLFNEYNLLPHRAFGDPVILTNGSTNSNKVLSFLAINNFTLPVDLRANPETKNDKYIHVNFTQYYNSLEVIDSRLYAKLTLNHELVVFGLDVFSDIDISVLPTLTTQDAILASSENITSLITNSSVDNDLRILPVPNNDKYEYHLVYVVHIETRIEKGPADYICYVNAHNGEVLMRKNNVMYEASPPPPPPTNTHVEGDVYTTHPFNPSSVVDLQYLNVQDNVTGTNYYTDILGNVTLASSVTQARYKLEGLYATVETNGFVPEYITSSAIPSNFSFDNYSTIQERTAYYAVNMIHDHMKSLFPTFTGLDNPMETNVDEAGSCNAYYSGSLNFYAEGNGCNATAKIVDIVYHEYGHAINNYRYNSGGGLWNGACGEGFADIWALSLTEYPVLGEGWLLNDPLSNVRNYDTLPKVYPQDLTGEVHADGEIICGAFWHTYENLGSMSQMLDLFTDLYDSGPDGPDGLEGIIYTDILLEFLYSDDNDGNIFNGTPNDNAIVDAFALHGITLLSNAVLTHTEIDESLGGVQIDVDANIVMTYPWALNNAFCYYKLNNSTVWDSIPLSIVSGNDYSTQIPSQVEGTVIAYYLSLIDNYGKKAAITPFSSNLDIHANLPFFILVGYELMEEQDFDFNIGFWSVSDTSDNATSGHWEIGVPEGTYDDLTVSVQPSTQHTPGGSLCAFTGNGPIGGSIGANDVDGGHTTLTSPTYDLTNYTNPTFSYYRWYTNSPPTGANPAADWWQVQVTDDGSNWVYIENNMTSDNRWRKFSFRVSDYVTITSDFSIRFIASDSIRLGQYLDGGSLVEAAVDDLMLYEESVYIGGCTDSISVNYNPSATVDDGSCIYCNISSSFYSVNPTAPTSCDGFAMVNASSTYPIVSYNWTNSIGVVVSTNNSVMNLCNDVYIFTVTDSAGCTFVDTLIVVTIYGCTDSLALNYNPVGNTDDGSCQYCNLSISQFIVVQNSSPSACDGWAYANAVSSNGPVLYLWNDGSTQNNIVGLCTGIYTLTVTDAVGCSVDTTFVIGSVSIYGCTDVLAINYDPTATVDDSSCTYATVCTKPSPTGLYVDNIIHSQAQVHWDNMSDAVCMALKYYIQIREVGTTSWTNKLAQDAGLCNFGLPTTSKMFTQLASNTTYEYRMKSAYCNVSGTSGWTALYTFTTADDCPNVTNFTATPGPQTNKVVFSWDTTSSYSFVRVKLRVDSISAPTGSDWFSAGGFGVNFPALSVNKWGVFPGETYRGQARTWCNPNAGLYRSAAWTSLVWWTQPTSIRIDESNTITDLNIYPNPSRDVFNVSFISETKQTIDVRVVNLIGEIIFVERLKDFEGEYTHSFNLEQYSKGIYLLELDTDNGIINKKLILQ